MTNVMFKGLYGMRESAPIRKRETLFILDHLKSKRKEGDCLIIGGDFNESDTYDSALHLRHERGMRDALEYHNGHTHWWPLKHVWRNRFLVLRSRLDHIFFEPDAISCKGVAVLEGYEGNSSDHLPVVGTFEIGTAHHAKQAAAPSWWSTTHSVGFVEIPEDSCWRSE